MALATDLTTQRVEETIHGDRRDIGGAIFAGVLLFALIASLAVLLLLFWNVGQQRFPVLAERGLSFLTDGPSGSPSRAGVGPALFGSVIMMVFVALRRVPPRRRGRRLHRGIRSRHQAHPDPDRKHPEPRRGAVDRVRDPGPRVFVVALQKAIAINEQGALLSGGLTLAVLILPIVIITTSEALRAVPNSVREAAYGVGATQWEVIRSHVLPYALPGILTGVIVSLARAFGETAPLLLVGAVQGFFATGGGGIASSWDATPRCPSNLHLGEVAAASVPGSGGRGDPGDDGGLDLDERHRDLAQEPV